ncbi:hypothetical protein [Cohnella zeiphila]|uniref:Calcineurin-like phosphoesterase domain-containing protein n=1 Tax=Cohnella zeiphila TaxID=2761120 RepID=A0A7X0VZJ8_9BACL|nr:hypothetical protein [Cohnella zeiphila]MBB6734063.1 hypothetical protein [Cohnella zeiphila]
MKQLKDTHPDHVVALNGNHEKSFAAAEMEELVEWVCNLPLIYEDDQFIFTHFGLNLYENMHFQQAAFVLFL